MTLVLIVMLYTQFSRYLSFPYITKVNAIINSELDFPAVTICNLNIVHDDITTCLGPEYADGIYSLFEDMSDVSILERFISSPLREDDIPGELLKHCFKDSSPKLNEFLGHCVWEGTLKDCSEIFNETVTEYGLCFTFNGDATQRANTGSTGSTSGLHVLVNIQQDKYFFSKTLEAGVKVRDSSNKILNWSVGLYPTTCIA